MYFTDPAESGMGQIDIVGDIFKAAATVGTAYINKESAEKQAKMARDLELKKLEQSKQLAEQNKQLIAMQAQLLEGKKVGAIPSLGLPSWTMPVAIAGTVGIAAVILFMR